MPAFAAEGDITATDVTTAIGTEPEATVAPESLKADAADEEGMPSHFTVYAFKNYAAA